MEEFMRFNILKILLYLISFSFIPLMFDVATLANLRRPEIILPIVISSGLLVIYCIFLFARCYLKHGKNCFSKSPDD